MSEPKAGRGTLYLVGTPLGNLEDITARAIRVLGEVDLVAAEDTRHTLKLLTHFGIKPKRLESCFEHNEKARTGHFLEVLGQGRSIALVTDAGMPGISDPGAELVEAAVEAGYLVTPIPGPTALTAALAASGLSTQRFLFVGFLPSKGADRREALLKIKSEEATLVFYEGPHRLSSCLVDLLTVLGSRKAVVAREMTKLHEEFVRGSLEELRDRYASGDVLGEVTLLVEGSQIVDRSGPERWVGSSIEEHLKSLMADQGLSKTEAVKAVAKLRGLPREVVYEISKDIKRQPSAVGGQPSVES